MVGKHVRSSQAIAVVAKVLGIPKASLGNWVRLTAGGELGGDSEGDKAPKAWDMRSSMSRKGNCWDNAPTESFWGRLKTASVHGMKFAPREQARQAVRDWMAFYNHRRLHSMLDYLSTMQYEQRWYEAQRKKAA